MSIGIRARAGEYSRGVDELPTDATDATDSAAQPRQVPRLPCPRCRQPSLVEVRRYEAALKMGGLVLMLFWSMGVGFGLIVAGAAILLTAWPPQRRWHCQREADCGYEQPLL